jgi:hypothetical protein
MSEWLRTLPLNKAFGVSTIESHEVVDSIPEWVGFLIWAGWLMNRKSPQHERTVLVILLPTRICCSVFCCLGALIRSIERGDTILSWDQFLALPAGSKVCVRYPGSKTRMRKKTVEGIVGRNMTATQAAREITITSKNKSYNALTQWVFQCKFNDYEITPAAPLSSRMDSKLSNIMIFYKTIVKGFRPTSVLAWSRECLLVTNLASWRSEAGGVMIFPQEESKRMSSYTLHELLMPSHDLKAEYSGIFLSTPKSDKTSFLNSPIAILNGPEAIKSWDRIRSSNVIMLLDHTEYDDTIENFLAPFSDARNDKTVVLPEGIPADLPAGVELVIFALT